MSIADVVTQMEQAREEGVTKLKGLFAEAVKEFFGRNPELEGFRWTQYTPWFNDGDTCVFGVNVEWELEFGTPQGHQPGQIDSPEYAVKVAPDGLVWEEQSTYRNPVAEELSKLLQQIPDDVFKEMFGDHCRVSAMRSGEFLVEEYEHD